ncbi:MAG: hypothetical protein WKI04_17550 [Ferruginibacter sp.]
MNLPLIKYFSVSLLLILFLFRGLENAFPLLAGYLNEDNRQEIKLIAEAEKNNEKNGEKQHETKEFLAHFYNVQPAYVKYAASLTMPAGSVDFLKEVCLPLLTPPPEFIINT